MEKKIDIFPDLLSISRPFRGVLLDVNGVLVSGSSSLSPSIPKILSQLIFEGKTVGILTNSTQIASKTIGMLKSLGLNQEEHFHFLLTSGEITKDLILRDELPFKTPKKKYFVFGNVHPNFLSLDQIFKDAKFSETKNLKDADFIHISIPNIDGLDQSDPKIFFKEVEKLKGSNVPMLCINPDLYAHEGNPAKLIVRQGSIAAIYEKMGGEVFYTGKPSVISFSKAMNFFRSKNIFFAKEILMVGDTPEIDVLGAKSSDMATALVTTTGTMGHRIAKEGRKAIDKLATEEVPDFFIERL